MTAAWTRWPALFLGLLLLPGCIVVVDPPAEPPPERRDYPLIHDVDAFCAGDGWWEFNADVSHPDGNGDVDFVWAEVTEVWWNAWGEQTTYTYLGDVSLGYTGDGLWYAEEPSTYDFLDCSWPYDYDLRFVAEDLEGDTDSFTITR